MIIMLGPLILYCIIFRARLYLITNATVVLEQVDQIDKKNLSIKFLCIIY
jgi:hypothetical protein